MTERERLIELLQSVPVGCTGCRGVDTIADYLIENGVIVPTVRVGDIVYIQYKNKIYPVDVYAIRYDTKTNNKRICVEGWLQIDKCYRHRYSATFRWESIGKSVFLTYEDAEKALSNKE